MLQNTFNRLRLTWNLMRDSRVPMTAKAIPIIAIIYVISPLDLIPLFPIDDIAIIIGGMEIFERMSPDHVVAEYRAKIGMDRLTS